MLVLSLVRELIVLLIMLACGVLLVKTRLADATDSRVLSVVCVYLVVPCSLIKAFQIEYSGDIRNGFFLAMAVAAAMHLLFFLLTGLLARPLRLDTIEKMSVVYTNGGTLVMALVLAIFGQEWVIYTSAWSFVQTIFIWTHGQSVMRGLRTFNLRKIFGNINIVAIVIGFFLFVTQIRLPELVDTTVSGIGSMLGPASMIMMGMAIGGTDFRQIIAGRRAYLSVLLRLIVVPGIALLLLKGFAIARLVPDGETIVLISLLSITAPAALTVTQLAQIYGGDVIEASSINVISTVLSVLTMPMWVMIYQIIL